jgi:hypothetical protein
MARMRFICSRQMPGVGNAECSDARRATIKGDGVSGRGLALLTHMRVGFLVNSVSREAGGFFIVSADLPARSCPQIWRRACSV